MYKLRGAYVKWQVLKILGVSKRKRIKHLAITDRETLRYWEDKLIHLKKR